MSCGSPCPVSSPYTASECTRTRVEPLCGRSSLRAEYVRESVEKLYASDSGMIHGPSHVR